MSSNNRSKLAVLQELELVLHLIRSTLEREESPSQLELFESFVSVECERQSLRGKISLLELPACLRQFLGENALSEEQMKSLVELEEVRTTTFSGHVTLTDLLQWWEEQKSRYESLWFVTKVKTKSLAQNALGLFSSSSELFHERLEKLSLFRLTEGLAVYKQEFYQLKVWIHQTRLKKERVAELALLLESKQISWSEQEKEDLLDLFCRFAKGKPTIGIETELPLLCAILNLDLPYSALELLMSQNPSGSMDFPTFLSWWGTRPEAKKIKTPWKLPLWRWYSENPRGLEIAFHPVC